MPTTMATNEIKYSLKMFFLSLLGYTPQVKLRHIIIQFVLTKPKLSLGICFLIAASFLYPITLIEKNFAGRYWLPQFGSEMQALNDYESKFGSDETLSTQIYNPHGILTKENIE